MPNTSTKQTSTSSPAKAVKEKPSILKGVALTSGKSTALVTTNGPGCTQQSNECIDYRETPGQSSHTSPVSTSRLTRKVVAP